MPKACAQPGLRARRPGRGKRARASRSGPAPRFWFNPELKSRYFLVPGAIAIVMTMIGTLLTALVVAREWERGTMEAMMATPVTHGRVHRQQGHPLFPARAGLDGAVHADRGRSCSACRFAARCWRCWRSPSAFLMPALGLGLFISAATKNQFVASQIALLSAFLPAFLLSGFLFEIASMPAPIQAITYRFRRAT